MAGDSLIGGGQSVRQSQKFTFGAYSPKHYLSQFLPKNSSVDEVNAMAKEAVRTLSRVGAIEWGRYGIRVNAICPLADSPGATNFDDSTGAYEAVTVQVPLGHWGDAESDIGRGAVYLAGPDAKFITGTTLMIDGGYNYLR